jgi:hypothetical protein
VPLSQSDQIEAYRVQVGDLSSQIAETKLYCPRMKAAQRNLFEYFEMKDVKKRYGRTQHGGASTKGRRKLERPLSKKRPLHLVLKSDKAKGQLSFLAVKNRTWVQQLLYSKAKRFGVKISDYANVGNHLHLKVRIGNRHAFQQFLKSVTTLIARHVTGARRGRPFGRFWQGLAFTRVLTSRLEELNLKGYIEANRVEAEHSSTAREAYLQQFNDWVYRERRKKNAPDP